MNQPGYNFLAGTVFSANQKRNAGPTYFLYLLSDPPHSLGLTEHQAIGQCTRTQLRPDPIIAVAYWDTHKFHPLTEALLTSANVAYPCTLKSKDPKHLGVPSTTKTQLSLVSTVIYQGEGVGAQTPLLLGGP